MGEGFDAEDINDVIKERDGEIAHRGIAHMHETSFATLWPLCSLGSEPLTLITPVTTTKKGVSSPESRLMASGDIAEHIDAGGSSEELLPCKISFTHMPGHMQQLLLVMGETVEHLAAIGVHMQQDGFQKQIADSIIGANVDPVDPNVNSIVLSLQCRYEWCSLTPSSDQVEFLETVLADLAAVLKVPTAEVEVVSVTRGAQLDIIVQAQMVNSQLMLQSSPS